METLNCLTIAATNQCPLKCAHCGTLSGPDKKGSLETSKVIEAIEEAKKLNCQIINFSGGEPFILGDTLIEMVKAATEAGLVVRITTGAYWSRTQEAALARLQPLAEAGLRQLIISATDGHREYVSLTNVVAASYAAKLLSVEVYISLRTSKNNKTNAAAVHQEFKAAQLAMPYVYESSIIPYGRAGDTYPNEELNLKPVEEFSGPCPSLTKNPSLHANGNITGCSVVFGQECNTLSFGNIHENSLTEIYDRMLESPLATWIHKVGVVELKQLIEANTQIRFKSQYVNICHLCGEILNHNEALKYLKSIHFIE
jgi:MoaA/NifB/PqqE/SkfB family radical SAM enzyme